MVRSRLSAFKALPLFFGCVAEALIPVNPLEDESVALAQGNPLSLHDGQHLADNLFMQLRVRGVSHVLFLHGGVDERLSRDGHGHRLPG